jgi:hypothetical protein
LLQLNCQGIKGKATELAVFLHKGNVKIAALQETKLTDRSKDPDFGPDYTLLRKDRGRGGGGLAFLIHKSIPFTPLTLDIPTSDQTTEALAVQVHFANRPSP